MRGKKGERKKLGRKKIKEGKVGKEGNLERSKPSKRRSERKKQY